MLFGTAQVLTSLGGTATVITTDLLVKTITYTTTGIFHLGENIFSSNNYVNFKQLQQLENDIDLLKTIQIYDLWIREVLDKNKDKIELSEAIKTTIHSISSILEDLHQILKDIDCKVEQHTLKWFQNWRSLDFSKEVEDIKYKKTILDSRFDILQKIHIMCLSDK